MAREQAEQRKRKVSKPARFFRRLTLIGQKQKDIDDTRQDLGVLPNADVVPGPEEVVRERKASLASNNSLLAIRTDELDTTQANTINISRSFVKVKVITWNMHENLPVGDLTDLLGQIPAASEETCEEKTSAQDASFDSRTTKSYDNARLPELPLQEGHPYHLIVVGAQESPYLPSTFLGEINSNLRGRENVTWTDVLEDWFCKGGGIAGAKEKNKRQNGLSVDADTANVRKPSKASQTPIDIKDFAMSAAEQPASPVSADSDSPIPEQEKRHTQSLPTQMNAADDLKRWRTQQASFLRHRKTESASSVLTEKQNMSEDDRQAAKRLSLNLLEDKKRASGPYVLVAKERLMGIYVAVFVLRSCQGLLKGTSKAHVAAGLIGGRVGNKGAAAVSCHFAGFRFLFVSAHLAAHQEGTTIRKQNVCKIKEELQIDTFETSTSSKPRATNDITDRFDFVFWFGDLNYRLDVSRLHADWLLQSKSYQTALEFDQLKALLREKNGCFKGFREGVIDFAPTYKYDLIALPGRRLLRRATSIRVATRASLKAQEQHEHIENMDQPMPKSPTLGSVQLQASDISDAASFTSVATSEVPDRATAPAQAGGKIRRGLFGTSPDPTDPTNSRVGRFRGLIRSKTSAAAPLAMGSHEEHAEEQETDAESPIILSSDQMPTNDGTGANLAPISSGESDSGVSPNHLPHRPRLRSSLTDAPAMHPSPSAITSSTQSDTPFDTSRKQRVQSWTDRILYKTTIYVEPVPPSMPRRLGSGVMNSIRMARQSFTNPSLSPSPSFSSGTQGTSPTDNQIRFDLPTRRREGSNSADGPFGTSPSDQQHYLLRRVSTGRAHESTSSPKRSRRASSNASRSSKGSNDISRTMSHPVLSFAESRRQRKLSRKDSNDAFRRVSEDVDERNLPGIAESDVTLTNDIDVPGGKRHRSAGLLAPTKLQLTKTLPISLASTTSPNPPTTTSPFAWRTWWVTHKLFSSSPREEDESAVADEDLEDREPTPIVRYIGPVRGEIQCLKYTSVNDLHKLQALTDHRPIYAEFAVGVDADRP